MPRPVSGLTGRIAVATTRVGQWKSQRLGCSSVTGHKHEFIREAMYYYDGARKLKGRCECGAKTFSWQRQVSPGVYVAGRGKHDPGLYSAGDGTERAWIVEGEKDVDLLASLGEVAFSPPDGAGSWKDEYVSELAPFFDRPIVIVADNDGPGIKH